MQLDEVPAAPLITMPPRQAKVGTIHEWILDILDNRLGLSLMSSMVLTSAIALLAPALLHWTDLDWMTSQPATMKPDYSSWRAGGDAKEGI